LQKFRGWRSISKAFAAFAPNFRPTLAQERPSVNSAAGDPAQFGCILSNETSILPVGMISHIKSAIACVVLAALVTVLGVTLSMAQDKNDKTKVKGDPDATTRVRIEISGGEKSIPVEMASVYVRYVIKHTFGKDEKVEMNVKTNSDGVAVAPYVPRRSVIVQVVAEGWKPFGQTYEIDDDEQVIKIHLERPPKWY